MAGETSIGILLHPGGGGAQYPFRFKPFRPRNLWRRTPGPNPPRGPVSGSRIIVVLIGAGLLAAVLYFGFTDWFAGSDQEPSSTLTVAQVEEAGFVVEQNILDGTVRVLNGEFQGVSAIIAIPEDGQTITPGAPELLRTVDWDQFAGDFEALRAGESLVICKPVPECSDLVLALAEVVFNS